MECLFLLFLKVNVFFIVLLMFFRDGKSEFGMKVKLKGSEFYIFINLFICFENNKVV